MPQVQSVRLAYLVSQYPTLSHVYILREVQQLRALGTEIEMISVDSPDRPVELLSSEERHEFSQTYYIKRLGASRILGSQLLELLAHPYRYVSALVFSIGLAGWSPRAILSHLLYFIEAVVAGRRMREQRVSHVHTHFSSTVALILSRAFPYTTSATIHGSGEFREPTAFHLAEKIASAKFVCAISKYGRSQMMLVSAYEHWNKIELCPLGVDTNLPRRRDRDHVTTAPFRVLSVGLLAAVKGYPVLLAAIARLVRAGRQVHLRIIGGGPDHAQLERLAHTLGIQEQVEFSGWTGQAGIQDAYGLTDAFVLASFAEGVPVVLMEAMAFGVPCVATMITGIPELIEHGVSGLLVTPSDEEALASAIERLMDDSELRRSIGTAAQQRVKSKYDLPANASILHDVLVRRLGAHLTTS